MATYGKNVNKVTVGEPAVRSPPKFFNFGRLTVIGSAREF